MSDRADTYLWYGETGTGKTAQIGEVAQYHYDTTGEITRLISADSGWDPIEHLIISPANPEGIIEAWNIQHLSNPFPVLIKLSEGYWPKILPDGRIVMLAPDKQEHKIISVGGKRVGQYFCEGISTFSAMIMQDHIRNTRKIKDVSMGEFAVPVLVERNGKQETETFKFGVADRTHFMQVQDFMLLDLVPRFSTLPVDRVVWTGHEAKGDDDITGIKGAVLGPATIGRAAVGRTALKFGDTFHFTKTVVDRKDPTGKIVLDPQTKRPQQLVLYRAYYEDHPDDTLTTKLWPAKLSLPLSKVKALHEKFPGGYVPLTLDGATMRNYLEFKHS